MISAIVLAAGNSLRMGRQNKLLLPYGNKTIIEQVVDQLLDSRVGEVVVVVGYEQNKIKAALAMRPVKLVFNSRYQTGMTTSIQTGVAAASPRARGYLICLGDMPALTAEDYNAVMPRAGERPEMGAFSQTLTPPKTTAATGNLPRLYVWYLSATAPAAGFPDYGPGPADRYRAAQLAGRWPRV